MIPAAAVPYSAQVIPFVPIGNYYACEIESNVMGVPDFRHRPAELNPSVPGLVDKSSPQPARAELGAFGWQRPVLIYL